jgi:transposase
MPKRYVVELTPAQREQLKTLISTGTAPAAALSHARILLKADAARGGPAWKDEQISDAFDISVRTVVRVRQAFCYRGVAGSIERKKRTGPRLRKLDGEHEAQLVALVCSPPPPGRVRWTLRLLCDEFLELTDLESISRETVRQMLKKTNLSLG